MSNPLHSFICYQKDIHELRILLHDAKRNAQSAKTELAIAQIKDNPELFASLVPASTLIKFEDRKNFPKDSN